MLGAVIVAAGSSRRMGFDKLAAELDGRPVLSHTLRAFQSAKVVGLIVVATRPDRVQWVHEMAARDGIGKLTRVIAGGVERQDSVLAGVEVVEMLGAEWVAVHDGARPLVTPEAIALCYAEAQRSGSGCLAAPVTDTLKHVNGDLVVDATVDRTNLWAMQTPQIFRVQEIKRAYTHVKDRNLLVTDEAAAIEMGGGSVKLVRNDSVNWKVTYPQDIPLAAMILAMRKGADHAL